MINISSIEKLKEKLLLEHPYWDPNAINSYATEIVMTCDKRLELIIENYISNNEEADYSYGEFTIYLIRALRHNCGFIEAIMLMNAYLTDSLHGKALILKR